MKVKIFYPLVVFMRWFIETNFFNAFIDMIERLTNIKRLEGISSYFEREKDRIQMNLDSLADEKSKLVYSSILKYRATLKRKYLKNIVDRNHYFASDIISFEKKEVFVDGGAYIGDTQRELCRKFPYWNEGGQIVSICFEPDRYNLDKCKKEIQKLREKYINLEAYVVPKGLWKEEAELQFEEGAEYASKILSAEEGENKARVRVSSIDYEISRMNERNENEFEVTFIKMDVEGAEPEALEGAKECILKYHPKLAISIYHTDEQMISIIEWIRENLPFYELYVRHYSCAWTETILYAINKNE